MLPLVVLLVLMTVAVIVLVLVLLASLDTSLGSVSLIAVSFAAAISDVTIDSS